MYCVTENFCANHPLGLECLSAGGLQNSLLSTHSLFILTTLISLSKLWSGELVCLHELSLKGYGGDREMTCM